MQHCLQRGHRRLVHLLLRLLEQLSIHELARNTVMPLVQGGVASAHEQLLLDLILHGARLRVVVRAGMAHSETASELARLVAVQHLQVVHFLQGIAVNYICGIGGSVVTRAGHRSELFVLAEG